MIARASSFTFSFMAAALASMACVDARADEPPRDVTFEEAIRLGRVNGPRARVAEAGHAASSEVVKGADGIAALPPRLTLTGGLRHGVDGDKPEIGASLVQDLFVSGLAGARRASAHAVERASASQARESSREAAASGASAWIYLAEASRVMELRKAARAEADALQKLAATRVKAGAVDPLEGALAASEVASARAAELEAEGFVIDGEAALRLALGAPVDQAVRAIGELDPGAPRLDEATILAEARAHRPSADALAARVEIASADAKLAVAALASPLGLGVSWLREGTGDHVVTALVAIPLPLVTPGSFDASRQRAAARVLATELEVDRDRVARDVRKAVHEREHTREVLEATELAVVASREALRIANVRWSAGTIDVSAVLIARARLEAIAERRVRAAADVRRADLKIEELRGALDKESP